MEFGKLQSLVGLDLSHCSRLVSQPNSIVHLSHFKTLRLSKCHKFKNLLTEFEKLQSFVKLNLSRCSELGCFASFNCGLVTTQNISIVRMPQIGESTNGVSETSNLGRPSLISLF
jgi:hypothetical protein